MSRNCFLIIYICLTTHWIQKEDPERTEKIGKVKNLTEIYQKRIIGLATMGQ